MIGPSKSLFGAAVNTLVKDPKGRGSSRAFGTFYLIVQRSPACLDSGVLGLFCPAAITVC